MRLDPRPGFPTGFTLCTVAAEHDRFVATRVVYPWGVQERPGGADCCPEHDDPTALSGRGWCLETYQLAARTHVRRGLVGRLFSREVPR